MTAKEALSAVNAIIPSSIEVVSCIEIEDSFVFATNPKGVDQIAPGNVSYQVFKDDGHISYYPFYPDKTRKILLKTIKG